MWADWKQSEAVGANLFVSKSRQVYFYIYMQGQVYPFSTQLYKLRLMLTKKEYIFWSLWVIIITSKKHFQFDTSHDNASAENTAICFENHSLFPEIGKSFKRIRIKLANVLGRYYISCQEVFYFLNNAFYVRFFVNCDMVGNFTIILL